MERDDTCGLCDETVNTCTCWRCMECETMHVDSEESMEDDAGEVICAACAEEAQQ